MNLFASRPTVRSAIHFTTLVTLALTAFIVLAVAGTTPSAHRSLSADTADTVTVPMSQTAFPCQEDEALAFHPAFGADRTGCLQREGADLSRLADPIALAHGKSVVHKTLVDASQTVAGHKLAAYVATHRGEFNREHAWHRITEGALADRNCSQHVGDTTWAVCAKGGVYSS